MDVPACGLAELKTCRLRDLADSSLTDYTIGRLLSRLDLDLCLLDFAKVFQKCLLQV